MAKVSILGSGMMGSALSRALLNGGHDVMVLDLDATKTEPLVKLGAIAAGNAIELAEHADVLLPSLPTYKGLQRFLESEGVISALQGKSIVQLSSGSPQTVEEFGEFIAGTGVNYLEGRIKNYPKDIGKSNSKIIFSGDEKIFEKTESVLGAIAQKLEYLGTELKTVAVLDEAVVTASYGQIWGLMLGGRLCQAHGVSPVVLLDLLKETTVLNLDDADATGFPDLVSGNFRENLDTSTIVGWASAGEQTLHAISAAGLDTTVFESIHALLVKAQTEGIGDKAIHAIAAVLDK